MPTELVVNSRKMLCIFVGVAVLVILLILLSESQFRRVEMLRRESPDISRTDYEWIAEIFNKELRVNEFIKLLPTASTKYNRLTELWYRKPETVVYRVDLNSPPSLPDTLEGEHVVINTPVTPEMSVELIGSAGLDIEPKGKIKKRVSDTASTSWEWKVAPIGTDEQFLILTTYVHISEDEDSEPYTLKSYEDVIKINVKFWDRLSAGVSTVQPVWMFVGIVVTALVGVYGWFRRKGWRAEKKPGPEIKGIRRGSRKSWWKGRHR